jgi:hypothetical protein
MKPNERTFPMLRYSSDASPEDRAKARDEADRAAVDAASDASALYAAEAAIVIRREFPEAACLLLRVVDPFPGENGADITICQVLDEDGNPLWMIDDEGADYAPELAEHAAVVDLLKASVEWSTGYYTEVDLLPDSDATHELVFVDVLY